MFRPRIDPRFPALAALLLTTSFGCNDDPATGTRPLDAEDAAQESPDDTDDDGLSDGGAGDLLDATDGADAGASDALDDSGSPDGGDADAAPDVADAEPRPALVDCTRSPFSFTPTGDWQHGVATPLIAWQDAGHSVEDEVATQPFDTWDVEGKFAYGPLGNDLEDEWVAAFVDTCTGWQALGRGLTDSDGRVRFAVADALLPGPGRYAVRMVVEVDGSEAHGRVLAVPADTAFVVFDIDGTLTTSDSELFADYVADLFGGTFVPEAYAGAVDVVGAYAEAGYEILYLTGRPYFLDRITREWLELEGFPVGTLHLTLGLGESLPTEDAVGAYKRDWLSGLLDDHRVARAYGNADTDIFAYREAGLPAADTYIIGDLAGDDGTQVVTTYPEHLDGLVIPPPEQPWE